MKLQQIVAVGFLVAVLATAVSAQEDNWLANLGKLAQDPSGVRGTMQQVEQVDKQYFAERLLRAVKTIPLTQEEKGARFARVAHELVAGSKSVDEKKATLGTIFTKADTPHLSSISDTLASGLDITRNGLGEAAFLDVATNVIANVQERTSADPDQVIRVAMTTATFLRAAGGNQDAKDAVLASLGDSAFANTIREVALAAAQGNYEPMLAANQASRVGAAQWYVGHQAAVGEPLMHPTGSQFSYGRTTGLDGLSFGGVDALPSAAQPYAGQNIKKQPVCGCCPEYFFKHGRTPRMKK